MSALGSFRADWLDVVVVGVVLLVLFLRFYVQPRTSARLLSARAEWIGTQFEMSRRRDLVVASSASPRAEEVDAEAACLWVWLHYLRVSPAWAAADLCAMQSERRFHEQGPLARWWRQAFAAAAAHHETVLMPWRRPAAFAALGVTARGDCLPGEKVVRRARPVAVAALAAAVALVLAVDESAAVTAGSDPGPERIQDVVQVSPGAPAAVFRGGSAPRATSTSRP